MARYWTDQNEVNRVKAACESQGRETSPFGVFTQHPEAIAKQGECLVSIYQLYPNSGASFAQTVEGGDLFEICERFTGVRFWFVPYVSIQHIGMLDDDSPTQPIIFDEVDTLLLDDLTGEG